MTNAKTRLMAHVVSTAAVQFLTFLLCYLGGAFVEGSLELSQSARVGVLFAYLAFGLFAQMVAVLGIAPELIRHLEADGRDQ